MRLQEWGDIAAWGAASLFSSAGGSSARILCLDCATGEHSPRHSSFASTEAATGSFQASSASRLESVSESFLPFAGSFYHDLATAND